MEKWVLPLFYQVFLSTGVVDKFKLFPQACFFTKFQKVFHSFSFHIPQALWKKIHYRQELIFAVISRMWFCKAVSPPANADSIFLMEYKMVV